MISHFITFRQHALTFENAQRTEAIKDKALGPETDQYAWLVFKSCHCDETLRRQWNIFGVLEANNAKDVPMRLGQPQQRFTGPWGSVRPDSTSAAREIRCRHCNKSIYADLDSFEEYVTFWQRHLVIYETARVYRRELEKDPIHKLVEGEEQAKNAYYTTRPLTLEEHMRYLGFTDFTPVEES